jgi:hypothetical protein
MTGLEILKYGLLVLLTGLTAAWTLAICFFVVDGLIRGLLQPWLHRKRLQWFQRRNRHQCYCKFLPKGSICEICQRPWWRNL